MPKINRENIQLLSRHSDLNVSELNELLNDHIYNTQKSWTNFLSIFFMSLGIGFSVAGIIFFFAFNWDELHKFVKFFLIEGLIIFSLLYVLFSKANQLIKDIVLTGSSILVGVLFAIFGQVYQTGANAYDFFFGWTISILIWALVANFSALWLVFVTLIHTTVILYSKQVSDDWTEQLLFCILFSINTSFIGIFALIKKYTTWIAPASWLNALLDLFSVTLTTIGICIGIFNKPELPFYILIGLTIIYYTYGIRHSFTTKKTFYLSIIPFSVIFIIAAFLLKQSQHEAMFFTVSVFIILGISLAIKTILDLQKKWRNEE